MLVKKAINLTSEQAEDGYLLAHDLIGTPAYNIKGDVIGFVKAAWYDPVKIQIIYQAEVIEIEEPLRRRMKKFDRDQGEG